MPKVPKVKVSLAQRRRLLRVSLHLFKNGDSSQPRTVDFKSHRRDAEDAEMEFFSFAVERPANENQTAAARQKNSAQVLLWKPSEP